MAEEGAKRRRNKLESNRANGRAVVLSAQPKSGEFVAMVAIPGSKEVTICRVQAGVTSMWTLLYLELNSELHLVGMVVWSRVPARCSTK